MIEVLVSLYKPQNVIFLIRLGKQLQEGFVEKSDAPILKYDTARVVTLINHARHRLLGHWVGQVQNILLLLELLV